MDLMLCSSYYFRYELLEGARSQPYAPLGILYLASYLRERGDWEVAVFDATFADGESEFERILSQRRPRVVGIQGVITTRRSARRMIEIAKEAGAIVVAGGPDPSVCAEQYLRWGADFVVMGEGELTTDDLMNYLIAPHTGEVAQIPGLAYRDGDGIHSTEPRARMSDLDLLPFPAYDLVDMGRYLDTWRANNGYSSMHIMASRGCPFACEWCSHAVFGRSFRQRSVDNVVAEMRFLHDRYAPDHFTIADDILGLDQRWLSRWCEAVERSGVAIPFRCFSRADIVNAGMLSKLKAVGCRHIYLGVESGSQRVLDRMNKGTTVEDIRRASHLIREAGIDLGYFIMFAYPSETRADVWETVRLIFAENPDSLGLSIAHPVPGTPFYNLVRDRLVRDADNDDEHMGSGRQLRFRASYPGFYYRRLIRYIEGRRASIQPGQSWSARFLRMLQAAGDKVLLWAIELFWPIRVQIGNVETIYERSEKTCHSNSRFQN